MNQLKVDADSIQRTTRLPDGPLGLNVYTLQILAGGFVLTSLIWSSGLAMIIDRRLGAAAIYFSLASALTLFGMIHSPLPGNPMFLPWNLAGEAKQSVFEFAIGYLAVAGILLALGAAMARGWIESGTSALESEE